MWIDRDLPQQVLADIQKAVKSWYLTGHLCKADYLALLQAIDDRNRLSHVYDEQTFRTILARLPGYAGLLQRVLQTLCS